MHQMIKQLAWRTAASIALPASAIMLTFSAPVQALPILPDVRAVYLVPSDRTVNPQYQAGVANALLDLQDWYATQLGGITFRLPDTVVQTVVTPHASSYYATNPAGGFATDFFYNVVNEGFSLTGGLFNDPLHRWLYYVDADILPGQGGGAALFGVAELPGADLRGLVGLESTPISRWIGGLGHELGHTFGLPHPSTCEPVNTPQCPEQALMWLGYLTYPDAFLLPEDKQLLLASPFFGNADATIPIPGTLPLLALALACLMAIEWKRSARGSEQLRMGRGWGCASGTAIVALRRI